MFRDMRPNPVKHCTKRNQQLEGWPPGVAANWITAEGYITFVDFHPIEVIKEIQLLHILSSPEGLGDPSDALHPCPLFLFSESKGRGIISTITVLEDPPGGEAGVTRGQDEKLRLH